jgi:addiction module HigA family antidote
MQMPTPVHPGQILKSSFMEPYQLSINAVAKGIGVTPNRVLDIIHGRRSITPDTALRLGKFFWNGTRFWTNLQTSYEEMNAELQSCTLASEIRPFRFVSGFDFNCLHCNENTNGQEIVRLSALYPGHQHVHKKCYATFIQDQIKDPTEVLVNAVIPEGLVVTLQEVAASHYDEYISVFKQADPDVATALTLEKEAVLAVLKSVQLQKGLPPIATQHLQELTDEFDGS